MFPELFGKNWFKCNVRFVILSFINGAVRRSVRSEAYKNISLGNVRYSDGSRTRVSEQRAEHRILEHVCILTGFPSNLWSHFFGFVHSVQTNILYNMNINQR